MSFKLPDNHFYKMECFRLAQKHNTPMLEGTTGNTAASSRGSTSTAGSIMMNHTDLVAKLTQYERTYMDRNESLVTEAIWVLLLN